MLIWDMPLLVRQFVAEGVVQAPNSLSDFQTSA